VERVATRKAPFCVGKIGLMAIIITVIGTHNVLANAKSMHRHLHHPFHLTHLRGGSINDGNVPSGGGGPQLNDEDLDEYIDFLLAYADDKATEEDNPLFRNEVDDAPLLEDREETMLEEEIMEAQEIGASDDALLEPMVDDVNDDTQLDAMVETLVASINDSELEGEEPSLEDHDDSRSSTIIIEEATEMDVIAQEDELPTTTLPLETVEIVESSSEPATLETPIVESVDSAVEVEDAEEIESDTFYLGSSAVENMPLPVNEEPVLVDSAGEDVEGDVAEEATEITTEATKRVPLFTSLMQKIGLKKEESQPSDVDSAEQIEEITIAEQVDQDQTTEIVLDSSDALEEPVITISDSDSQTPVITTPEEPDFVVAAVTVADEAVVDQDTKISVASSLKQYYQGALGSVKDIWSKKPWYGKATVQELPERDYNKIYEKYFAAANQEASDVDEVSTQEESNRLTSAFLRPWGTVAKYFEPKEGEADYSIGIQGFVAEDAEELEVEAVAEEVPEAPEVIIEITELEVDTEEVPEEAEVITEITELEVDIEDVPVDAEVITYDAEVEVVSEEVITEGIEAEIDNEEVPEVITEGIEIEVDIEEVPEDAEDISEAVSEEVPADAELITEGIETEVSEDAAVIDVEVAIEECPEDAEVVSEEVPSDAEVIIEGIEVEVDSEEILADAGVITEGIEAEVDAENIPADADFVIEGSEDEVEVDVLEVLEGADVILDGTEVEIEGTEDEVDIIEVSINAEETVLEASSEDTPKEVPRRANVFARMWGTTKVHNTINTVEVDAEVTGMETEGIVDETDHYIDDHKITSKEGYPKPNVFIRLWGTTKEPNKIYSLGVQGIKESDDSETGKDIDVTYDVDTVETLEEVEDTDVAEDEDNYVEEELDVDISVSIGIVEDGEESLDSLEIFESLGVEDMEEESYVLQLDTPEKRETVPSENASVEDVQADRNVFQLHIPERQERKDEESLPENAGIEVINNLLSSDDSNECDEITTLQLHQENSLTVPDGSDDIVASDQTFNEMPTESEMEVEYYPYTGDVEEDSEDLEDSNLIETAENAFSVGDEDDIEEETEAEDVTGFVVADAGQHIDSEEEELDEQEELEYSFVADTVEEISSEEDDDYIVQQEEVEEDVDVEEENFIELSEEETFLEEIEIVESEEEEEVYVNEIDEDEDEYSMSERKSSSPYSLEVEMLNANFLTRFLVNKGLEQVIMIAIVIAEWFRVYILAPFFDSIDWVVEGKGQNLLDTVMNTRGGALASYSESEDVDQTDEEEEIGMDEEEASTEERCTDLSDTEKPESGSLKDSHKGDTNQENSVESGENSPETAPAEKPLPALRQVPPNFIFRRLQYYGRIGHILIMEIILASEWFNLYVPQIQSITNYILYDVLKHKKRSGRKGGEPDNYMDGGFVNTGEGSRLPKASRKQRKKEDEKALDQLKNIGNVNQARYRFISESFMERHGLGPYSVAVSEIELDYEGSVSNKDRLAEEEEAAESDSGWILDALGVEEEEDFTSKPTFDTNVGLSVGNGGPKASVGVELTFGKKKTRKQSSSQIFRSVIDGSSISSKPKKPLKPPVSDNESGLMGRLRAQGANSLVGRSLLGAYPGDLPPPDEAANPRGVIDLARRYGYGDWSDEEDDDDEADEYLFGGDDDDDDDDDDENHLLSDYDTDEDEFRPKKRTKTRKRRSSSSRNKQSVGVGFDIVLGSPSQEPIPVSRASTSRRRKSASSTAISSSLSGSRRRRKTRSSLLPSLAMESLDGSPGSRSTSSKSRSTTTTARKSATPSSEPNTKEVLTDSPAQKMKRRRKTSTLRPAMSILDETKKVTGNTSTKSQNEDQ